MNRSVRRYRAVVAARKATQQSLRRALEEAIRARDDARATLQSLIGFRTAGTSGAMVASAALLADRRQFRARLETAIAEQRSLVTAREEVCAAALARWQESYRSQRLAERLATKARERERQSRDRLEQKLSDELAAIRHARE